MSAKNWQRAAPRAEVKAGEMLGLKLGEEQIGLTELGGEVHAFADVCPHAYALLSQGWLEGEVIECPLHAARFEVKTGKLLDGPDCENIQVYETKVEGGDVWVLLP